MDFKVINRDKGHWDIIDLNGRRIYKIRGHNGDVSLINDDEKSIELYNSVQTTMNVIIDRLMWEA